MEFSDIVSTSKVEQTRAWCVEKALEYRQPYDSDAELLNTALAIEHYVRSGRTTHAQLEAVLEEGLSEGRFEVKQKLLDDSVDEEYLDRLFIENGWQLPPPDTTA